MEPRWEISRRPQSEAPPQERLSIQAEYWFYVRGSHAILEIMPAVLRRGRFKGKIGAPCLSMAPCHIDAGADPGLQPLPRQTSLQVGKVTQKVQHPARTHRSNLLAPRQGLESLHHWHERERTPDETEKRPGIGSNRPA